ncbi:MAG TPA: gephyrin-like molybdotransferase Glp [Acidobacteriaceae bacterium]|jgi:molybdopterin molybdotransferase|nr:gephyrin-like molybdotransferase Glp [Acidobacteriaceae bacterium]
MAILSFEQALATVLEHAARASTRPFETVRLLDSPGRVLAEPIIADRDQPPFDRATRDGFAVRAVEWSSGQPLRIAGQIRAGQIWQHGPIQPGMAVEIMTGAPVPPGADAVAMVEHAAHEGDSVRAAEGRQLTPGENIVHHGTEARAGETVVPSGTLISAAEIAEAATCGVTDLQVYRRPAVAILATGDELVELTGNPSDHQIRNSNSYALAALIQAAGGSPGRLEIARDTREDLRERILQGRMSDLLLLSGGVSAGKYDLVEEVLAEFDAEFLFTGVKMQPGKPVVFGRIHARQHHPNATPEPECYFFGLPGNPISTEVTFHCFVVPMLRALSGAGVSPPRFVQAALAEDVPAKPGITRVLPARLTPDLNRPSVRLVPWHGSGDLAANARANCYAILPGDRNPLSGDGITVLLR